MKIGLYLLPAVLGFLGWQDDQLASSVAKGHEIYQDFCLTCHLSKGEGIEEVYPPLANSDYLVDSIDASIRAVKYGLEGKIIVNGKVYDNIMAPLYLSDQEVMDVMNFILNSWGNQGDFITLQRVQRIGPK